MKTKRVLITGGTGTLGSALVRALINEPSQKFKVTANFAHDSNRAQKLAESTGCELLRADVSDPQSIQTLFAGNSFDSVVHLAGTNQNALLLRTSIADWQTNLQMNLHSAFLITRACLQSLPVGGQLILASSRVGERGYPGQSAYSASKGAILALMKTAAIEGQTRNIAVNAICPGFARSALSQDLSEDVLNRRNAENWLPHSDAAQSFAAMCVWLLSTSTITGQILRPDCRI